MPKKNRSKNPGRPKGAANRTYQAAKIVRSRCLKCSSSERSPYGQKTEKVINGKRIIWRRCQCLQCGQWRIDKEIIPLAKAA
jgi:hypothetical protein